MIILKRLINVTVRLFMIIVFIEDTSENNTVICLFYSKTINIKKVLKDNEIMIENKVLNINYNDVTNNYFNCNNLQINNQIFLNFFNKIVEFNLNNKMNFISETFISPNLNYFYIFNCINNILLFI